jgi:hypothetical protein
MKTTVEGTARNVQRSSSSYMVRQQAGTSSRMASVSKETCTFQVEQFDGAGNRLPPIPVMIESRKAFSGSLADGDRVRVTGKQQRGGPMKAKEIVNLSLGVKFS